MTASLAGKIIFVTGATGQQGGAVAQHLLARGFGVRALVRDPEGLGARRLASIGAELIVGDMDDGDSIRAAMSDAYGAFSVQPARRNPASRR